jgi:hypothetical protein
MWGNTAPNGSQIFEAGGSGLVTFCDIQAGWAGSGNINADPQFIRVPSRGADARWGTADDDYGDLRLQATSPCIDAGSNAYVPTGVTTDLAGQARFADVPGVRDPGVITDMGAYEAATSLAVTDRDFLTDATSPTVKLAFNANLATSTLNGGDLQLLNQTTGDLFDTSTLATTTYDLATFSASWLLPINLPDANRDRFVDTQDFNLLAANFGGSAKVFSQGNFDYDVSGNVNSIDFDIFIAQYGKSLPAPAVFSRTSSATAPPLFAGMHLTSNEYESESSFDFL